MVLVVQIVVIEQLLRLEPVLGRDPLNEVVSHWNARLSRVVRVGALPLRPRVYRHALIRVHNRFVEAALVAAYVVGLATGCHFLILLVLVQRPRDVDDDHADVLANAVFVLLVEIREVDSFFAVEKVFVDVFEDFEDLYLLYFLEFVGGKVLA